MTDLAARRQSQMQGSGGQCRVVLPDSAPQFGTLFFFRGARNGSSFTVGFGSLHHAAFLRCFRDDDNGTGMEPVRKEKYIAAVSPSRSCCCAGSDQREAAAVDDPFVSGCQCERSRGSGSVYGGNKGYVGFDWQSPNAAEAQIAEFQIATDASGE